MEMHAGESGDVGAELTRGKHYICNNYLSKATKATRLPDSRAGAAAGKYSFQV